MMMVFLRLFNGTAASIKLYFENRDIGILKCIKVY